METIEAGNINAKWLDNVYENIKKLEYHEQLMLEGCSSILDYLGIPFDKREIILGDTQFKNLKFYITQFSLLLSDLTPVIEKEKIKEFKNGIQSIKKVLPNRKLFVNDIYNSSKQLIKSVPTSFFDSTANYLMGLKVELFIEIKDILYIKAFNTLGDRTN